jgi:lipid II:glycine glycyltransferase (peptidoglycan interpeptide bridge formation enzyme)
VFLKVEPDIWEKPDHKYCPLVGFRASPHAIQPPRTIILDLKQGEANILSQMKQKTRYNVRLAEKRGIEVTPSRDIDTFYQFVFTTGQRNQFEVHSLEYYRIAYQLFYPRGECELLIANYKGTPLAGLMVFSKGKRAWYFYGGSSEEKRDLMSTYILQWEAMRWARLRGCVEYDLWGVPDADQDVLERDFLNRSDGLWGIYRFKRGFGGILRRSLGAWDKVYNYPLYLLYRVWISRRLHFI